MFVQDDLKTLSQKLEALSNLLRHPPEAAVIVETNEGMEKDPVILITAPSVESDDEKDQDSDKEKR